MIIFLGGLIYLIDDIKVNPRQPWYRKFIPQLTGGFDLTKVAAEGTLDKLTVENIYGKIHELAKSGNLVALSEFNGFYYHHLYKNEQPLTHVLSEPNPKTVKKPEEKGYDGYTGKKADTGFLLPEKLNDKFMENNTRLIKNLRDIH